MTAPALIEVNDPFTAVHAMNRMHGAGFVLELDGPDLVVSPADRLSESQRAFIRAGGVADGRRYRLPRSGASRYGGLGMAGRHTRRLAGCAPTRCG